MWLRHFFNQVRRGAMWPAVLIALSLSACSTLPGLGGTASTGDDAAAPVAPAAVLTEYERAVAAMAAGEDVEAELRFAEFLLRYPDYPGAHVNMAILKARAGDDMQAEASIMAALRLEPNHAAALNQLGILRRRQGRFAEAETAYSAAIAADPGYSLAHYNRGVLNELYLQRLAVALRHFEKFQELGGDDKQVGKWIVDLQRRIAANQRTANVTE